jgi:hypothetical protein
MKIGFKVAGEKENGIIHRREWRTIRRLSWKLEEHNSSAGGCSELGVLETELPAENTG